MNVINKITNQCRSQYLNKKNKQFKNLTITVFSNYSESELTLCEKVKSEFKDVHDLETRWKQVLNNLIGNENKSNNGKFLKHIKENIVEYNFDWITFIKSYQEYDILRTWIPLLLSDLKLSINVISKPINEGEEYKYGPGLPKIIFS